GQKIHESMAAVHHDRIAHGGKTQEAPRQKPQTSVQAKCHRNSEAQREIQLERQGPTWAYDICRVDWKQQKCANDLIERQRISDFKTIVEQQVNNCVDPIDRENPNEASYEKFWREKCAIGSGERRIDHHEPTDHKKYVNSAYPHS